MITVETLFSGSSGNCTLIRTEKTAVLVDAGKNCKAVLSSLDLLGLSLSDLSAVFVTHEHRDHISALDVMMRRQSIPIHVTSLSAPELCRGRSAAENAVIHAGLLYEVQVGDLTVRSFPLPHDSAGHVGYVFVSGDGDSAGVATDMGYATMDAYHHLRRCRTVVLEANHDLDMLRTGSYPFPLKQRILSRGGHLSNTDCADLCCGLAACDTEQIILAHLSRENNTPEKAYTTVRSALEANGHPGFALSVARRDLPGSVEMASLEQDRQPQWDCREASAV